MNEIKCLVVDDEPIAAQVIKSYLDKLDSFALVETCENALQAFEYLQTNRVDLLFLDIQMPKITGLEFLKTLQNPPKVILVTAYREFAFEGFELDVVDYLLKPVSFERFLKAINKFTNLDNKIARSHLDESKMPVSRGESIWVRADRKNVKIQIDDIHYIEGLKDYVKIYVKNGLIISKMPMKNMEKMLPSEGFIRIHRSYLVPISKITAFNNEGIEIDSAILPIGKMYKESVIRYLEQYI
jgi:DNA-binding LytR/AlgR family response regulator